MKHSVFGLAALLALALPLVSGCKRTLPPDRSVKGKTQSAQADPLKSALDLMRKATEVGQYRDALHQLNAHLSTGTGKQVTPLASDEKDALAKLYRLSSSETADLDAILFRPADAYHLESCGLFRDAGRFLEIANAPPLEQARACFDWVMRCVGLHEQGDEGLPPAFVLRRGFGSGLDRALVFLALLQQFKIDGCLLASRERLGEASGPILVGVLLPRDHKLDLALFDPRLGHPIPGAGPRSIATLDEARAHPELLKRSAIPVEAIANLEVFQAGPLEALPARMRYLQGMLEFQDKIILFQDAVSLSQKLAKAAGRASMLWDSSHPQSPSPARALRAFVGSENGTVGNGGRQQRFKLEQMALPAIVQQFQEMRLLQTRDIPDQARDILLHKAEELYTLFSVQPREYFLHGQFDAALPRIDRIRTVLETEEAATPLEGADFQRRLGAWRVRVFQAYTSLIVHKEAEGQSKVNAIWNEDQYLLNVLHPESEYPLPRFEKKMPTLILVHACREPLGQQVNYLAASCLHEKAAKLEATRAFLDGAGKDVTNIKTDVEFAWRNARGAWVKFLGRYHLGPKSLSMRLAEIQQRWNVGDPESALHLWEQLHLDLHTSVSARMRLAETQQSLEGSSPALHELLADLESFQSSALPKSLNEFRDKVRANPQATLRLNLLARDWESQGNIHWLRESALYPLTKY